MRTHRLFPMALLLALLAPTAAAVAVDVQIHEIEGGGFHVVPETIDAKAGDTLRLTAFNDGFWHENSPHDIVLCGDPLKFSGGLPVPPSPCGQKLGFTTYIPNNETRTLTAKLPEHGGKFAYYCDIPGHAEAGMMGVLTVQGPPAPTKTSPGVAALGTLISLAVVALLRRR